MVGGESRGHSNRRHECEKRAERRHARVWRIGTFTQQYRLHFNRLVDNRIEPIISHDLQYVEHQFLSSLQMLVVLSLIDWICDVSSSGQHLIESRLFGYVLPRVERCVRRLQIQPRADVEVW